MIICKKGKAFIYASVCTISSVLGGLFGYLIGFALFNSIGIFLVNLYGMNEYIENLKAYYDDYGMWFVLVAGFTPVPFKIITIGRWFISIKFINFILCSFIARGFKILFNSRIIIFW